MASQVEQYVAALATKTIAELKVERDAATANADMSQLELVVNELLNRQAQLHNIEQEQPQAQPSFVLSKIKIEKPKKFSGNASELSNFLFSVEQYMNTVGLVDDVGRQQFAATMLSGRAMTWWRTWVDRLPQLPTILKFKDFAIELEKQFRDVDHVDRLRRRLSALHQKTSVAKYIDAFREIIIELGTHKPDPDTILFQFINGLKRDVQLHVRLTQPTSLVQAELVAEQTDSAMYLSHNRLSVPYRSHPQSNSRSHAPVPMELGITQSSGQRKHITCYRCGKVGHMKRDCRVRLNKAGEDHRNAGQGRGSTKLQTRGTNLHHVVEEDSQKSSKN